MEEQVVVIGHYEATRILYLKEGFVVQHLCGAQNFQNGIMITCNATDWLPTIVEGIAGLELDKNRWALDGYNMWPTITSNSETPIVGIPESGNLK